MTARRLRESPRVVAAGLLLAGLLILIGILVATTAATGSTHTQTVTAGSRVRNTQQTPAAAGANTARAAALQADRATIAKLRATLSTQTSELSSADASLHAARANARCWHSKVVHPIKTRTLHCVAPLPPSASTP